MKYSTKLILIAFCIQFFSFGAKADEGMWLPLFLEQLNEKEMKAMGMKISAKDIYDINKGSLKDAIVSFGGFCTGEVVSNKGLVFTNHHCGFKAIQSHSTLDNNYIRDGFWAKNSQQELPNAGLYVTFIVSIHDVTNQMLVGLIDGMPEVEREKLLKKNTDAIIKSKKIENYQESIIRPFFEGNKFFLFVTEKYTDIRLVGAPPSAIGNFGQDSDNWMWPRHTGDFSVFRIYAGKDNKPAAYSADNVPYVPKKSFSISMDGIEENDFTMVFGFPGKTMQYLPAVAVNQILKISDPVKIALRDNTLSVLDGFMRKDEKIKIQYAAKYAGISNAWKKWQGEVLGLSRTNAVGKKEKYEAVFASRIASGTIWKNKYGTVLSDFEKAYEQYRPLSFSNDYYNEIIGRIELFAIIGQLNALVKVYENNNLDDYNAQLKKVKEALTKTYKDYAPIVDQKLFEILMPRYKNDQDKQYVSPMLISWLSQQEDNFERLTKDIFASTPFDEEEKTMNLLNQSPAELIATIRNDKAALLFADIQKVFQEKVQKPFKEKQTVIDILQRNYMQAQMEVMKEKKFYPDANSTLRISYGNVKGYQARDAVNYNFYTYLDGVMEKYKPGDYEFNVPEKLIQLYKDKDYGPYGEKGKMPVCFIAKNHTTGGNSGSPALDAYGNLIGINFDRAWEGTMSDINYDPSICRNIMVDIRYVLFIIDKYAGAGHLVQEMKLVHPKKAKK